MKPKTNTSTGWQQLRLELDAPTRRQMEQQRKQQRKKTQQRR